MKPNLIAKIFIRYRFVVLKPSRAEPRRGIMYAGSCWELPIAALTRTRYTSTAGKSNFESFQATR